METHEGRLLKNLVTIHWNTKKSCNSCNIADIDAFINFTNKL